MKESKNKINELPFDEELDIFGEHKTREQVRAEEKERRSKEREMLKQEILRRRQEAKENPLPTRRKDIIVVSAVVLGIVLLCVLALFNAFRQDTKNREWQINEARGHYVDEAAYPTMSGDGPAPALKEAYFTNNGHLYLNLLVSNGTSEVLSIESLDVRVYDFATNELIAGGKTELDESFIVNLAAVEPYDFYIAPEHILMDETASLPELVYCEVSFGVALNEKE